MFSLLYNPTPSTHSDILQVPTDLFNVNAAVKGHPATTEKPTGERKNIAVPGWRWCGPLTNPLELQYTVPYLLSGCGSDSATRMKPGYLLQSCKEEGEQKLHSVIQRITPSSSPLGHFILTLSLGKEKPTKGLNTPTLHRQDASSLEKQGPMGKGLFR